MTKNPTDTAPSEAAPISLDQILSGDYDQIILPVLQAIFGQTTSDRNPIVGTTGQTESFILDRHTTLLNSLDVRGDVDFVLAEGLDPSEPVLIYILTDLKLANDVTISTALNMTLRASRVYGDLRIVGTAGQPGCNGTSFSTPAEHGDPGIDRKNERGQAGRDAKEPIPPFEPGNVSRPGGEGPDGGRGGDGAHGEDGGDGGDGQDGNDIKLWVERFEDGGLFIDVGGGDAGAGGSGQDGGNGGDGGDGGTGGRGGHGAVIRSPSNGGRGGDGGDGGAGGNGGRAGLNGRPGDSGLCTAWGPGKQFQNAKPPWPIRINNSAGRPARPKTRHGFEGKGGLGGQKGTGGKGGDGTLLGDNGKTGPDGNPGIPGPDGSAYKIPIPSFEGHSTPPDIDFSKHPSAELSFLQLFITKPIAFVPKSTVIDDWGEQAYFEGMQLGPIGPDYSFNGGRSIVRWSDGSDLVIAQAGPERGLLVDGYENDPVSRWIELEVFCPTLLINIAVTSGARLRIEKGRFDAATGQTTWDPTPLENFERLSRNPTLPFLQGRLGTSNRLRFMGEEVFLHSLLVVDCSDCRSLPDC